MKPEITRSMIEIGSSHPPQHAPLLAELQRACATQLVATRARKLNIGIAGGGTHRLPALERAADLSRAERFHYISELYGYLAKQFTVFGQHVHVGCDDGDTRCGCCTRCRATCRISSR